MVRLRIPNCILLLYTYFIILYNFFFQFVLGLKINNIILGPHSIYLIRYIKNLTQINFQDSVNYNNY